MKLPWRRSAHVKGVFVASELALESVLVSRVVGHCCDMWDSGHHWGDDGVWGKKMDDSAWEWR